MNRFRCFVKKLATFFIKLFYPYKVYGKENLPKGRCVIVCNHYRVIDAVPFLRLTKGKVYFLVKKESFKGKFGSKFLLNYGCIPVDRENIQLKTIMSCIKVLKEEYPLVVFPEGTRNRTGEELQPIKGGAVVFATRTNSPVIPAMFDHKERFWRKSRLIIGKPVDLSEYDGKKLSSEDIDVITEKLRNTMIELRRELIEKTGKKRKNK